MIILSLNSGSSSLKYTMFDYSKGETVSSGLVERVIVGGSFIKYSNYGGVSVKVDFECPDHKTALKLILDILTDPANGVIKSLSEISAVGHRVVHGGEKFTKSIIIDEAALQQFEELYDLAPLHNPPNVQGIRAAMEVMPGVPQMAVMDTAWHQTMPASSYMYALPREWYQKYGVRRYGFHGTSLLYVSKRAAVLLGKDPLKTNLVCLHIGNGVSANAVKDGCSFDTSMGLTPLEGMVMGTRAGDHDAAIDLMIMDKEKLTSKDMNNLLNKKSGVYGITDYKYTDRRDVELAAEEGDELSQLAIDIETYRIKKYIGAYMAAVGGVDAIVFTAGVGEMSPKIRGLALQGLEFFGIKIDCDKNAAVRTRNGETCITTDDSPVKVFVIPTDEERVIVEDTVALLNGTYDEHTKFVYPFAKADYVNGAREEDLVRDIAKNPALEKAIVRPKK